MKYHSIHELIDFDELSIIGIRSDDNTTDLFTKALTKPHYERLRGYLGIGPPSVP